MEVGVRQVVGARRAIQRASYGKTLPGPSEVRRGLRLGCAMVVGAASVAQRWFSPWVGKIPWRRAWQPTPPFLPGESDGQRSLAGYSPGDHKEVDRTKATEYAHTHWMVKDAKTGWKEATKPACWMNAGTGREVKIEGRSEYLSMARKIEDSS